MGIYATLWTLNCLEMFVKVIIVIFLSLEIEIESCGGGGGVGADLGRIMRVLKPAPYIEVDSS